MDQAFSFFVSDASLLQIYCTTACYSRPREIGYDGRGEYKAEFQELCKNMGMKRKPSSALKLATECDTADGSPVPWRLLERKRTDHLEIIYN